MSFGSGLPWGFHSAHASTERCCGSSLGSPLLHSCCAASATDSALAAAAREASFEAEGAEPALPLQAPLKMLYCSCMPAVSALLRTS